MASNANNGTVTKKRKVMERRSWVWDYFPFAENTKTFQCCLCATSVTIDGSSTQLLIRHLRIDHDKCNESSSTLLTNVPDSYNLSSDEYTSSEDEDAENKEKDKKVVKI